MAKNKSKASAENGYRRSQQRVVRRLALAVMKEAVQKGWADIWDPSWNHKAHVELTLTIAEVRLAASLIGYHPTKADISRGDELSKWDAYIAELKL